MSTYFTKEHEWIRIDDQTGTVGITAYAAEKLGDITFVELPPAGKKVAQFGVLSSIESVKAASDIYSPLSGEVLEANKQLDSSPEIINSAAEGEGWIARIKLSDPEEVSALMSSENYREFLKGLDE